MLITIRVGKGLSSGSKWEDWRDARALTRATAPAKAEHRAEEEGHHDDERNRDHPPRSRRAGKGGGRSLKLRPGHMSSPRAERRGEGARVVPSRIAVEQGPQHACLPPEFTAGPI